MHGLIGKTGQWTILPRWTFVLLHFSYPHRQGLSRVNGVSRTVGLVLKYEHSTLAKAISFKFGVGDNVQRWTVSGGDFR